MTNFYDENRKSSMAMISKLMAFPVPDANFEVGHFDPWQLFGMFGNYSSDFDEMAIAVLSELLDRNLNRHDLAAEMFREMLCVMGLCDYGTSPRACFPCEEFEAVLPELIALWKHFSELQWSDAS